MFAINSALQVAVEQKQSTVYVTTQLTPAEIARLLLSSIARVHLARNRTTSYTPEEWERISEAINLLKKSPLRVLDVCGLPFEQLRGLLYACKDWCPDAEESDVPRLVVVDSFDDLLFGFSSEEVARSQAPGLSPEQARTLVKVEELGDIAGLMEVAVLLLAGLPYAEGLLASRKEDIHDLCSFRQLARYVHAFMAITPGGAGSRHGEPQGCHICIAGGRYSFCRGHCSLTMKFDPETMRFVTPAPPRAPEAPGENR
jgi:hypothetical protein